MLHQHNIFKIQSYGVKGGRVFGNICKGHMDKTKGGWDHGWEVGMAGVRGVGVEWRQLYLNNDKKKTLKNPA